MRQKVAGNLALPIIYEYMTYIVRLSSLSKLKYAYIYTHLETKMPSLQAGFFYFLCSVEVASALSCWPNFRLPRMPCDWPNILTSLGGLAGVRGIEGFRWRKRPCLMTSHLYTATYNTSTGKGWQMHYLFSPFCAIYHYQLSSGGHNWDTVLIPEAVFQSLISLSYMTEASCSVAGERTAHTKPLE